MLARFKRIYAYEAWANLRIIKAMNSLEALPDRVIILCSHILVVQRIWTDRLRGRPSKVRPWEVLDLEDMVDFHARTMREFTAFLNSLKEDQLKALVPYTTTEGDPFRTSVADILTHLSHHSTYHRGQVVLLLKPAMEVLPATDFIIFEREGN